MVRPTPALRPDAKVFEEFAAGSGRQSVSTTMVFARLLRNLVRDPTVGSLVAPIVSDEARTFGLEPLIAEAKIYAPEGQHYIPVDADLPLNYAESASGQLLQEGISEAGALSTFIALSTAYATWGQPMVPVFLFYSMFGFQRVGDLAWALGDMRGRGILAGCTAGRTTLMGEGLQHDDGQSPLLASTNPAALVYDASFAYEVAVIMEAAVADMLGASPQDRFWYLTLYNETYPMPALPKGDEGEAVRRGIIDGVYLFAAAPEVTGNLRTSLCFSGPMWSIAVDAQRILAEYGIAADLFAVTSWSNLRTDALEVERWNRLHPEAEPRTAVITEALGDGPDPVVAITDYMRSVPDQVARFVDRPYTSLGTDGFGRSDARGRAAVVLRGRQRQPGCRRVAAARPGRKDRPIGGRRGDRRLGHRPRQCGSLHRLLNRSDGATRAGEAAVPSRHFRDDRSGDAFLLGTLPATVWTQGRLANWAGVDDFFWRKKCCAGTAGGSEARRPVGRRIGSSSGSLQRGSASAESRDRSDELDGSGHPYLRCYAPPGVVTVAGRKGHPLRMGRRTG